VFGASFGAARSYSPDSRGFRKTFGRAVNCTVSTVCASVLDGFPATATDVFRCRIFYSGHVAAFYFTLVALSKVTGTVAQWR
jgi:hypothetical protein